MIIVGGVLFIVTLIIATIDFFNNEFKFDIKKIAVVIFLVISLFLIFYDSTSPTISMLSDEYTSDKFIRDIFKYQKPIIFDKPVIIRMYRIKPTRPFAILGNDIEYRIITSKEEK